MSSAGRFGRSIPPTSSTRPTSSTPPGRRVSGGAESTRCRPANRGYTDQSGVFHSEYVLPAALNHLAPDKVDNYEIGAKGTLAGRFSYSVAVYDIEWHNVQEGVQLTPLVLPAAFNIGEA